jgi:hypothetical protein
MSPLLKCFSVGNLHRRGSADAATRLCAGPVRSRGYLSQILSLAAFLLLAIPTGAFADTINLDALPAQPARGSQPTILVFGSESSISEEIVISALKLESVGCRGEGLFSGSAVYEESLIGQPLRLVSVGTPPAYSIKFAANTYKTPVWPDGAVNSILCGYLINPDEPDDILASTQLKVMTGPSEEEVQKVERERETPITHLSVTPVARYRHSSAHPGETILYVSTAPYAKVTVRLARHGHSTQELEWQQQEREPAAVVQWKCTSPGGTYRYTITARTNVGPTLTRHGTFTPVSAAHCHTLKQEEAQARERSAREHSEEVRRYEQEQHEIVERYESNCRAEGGTPIILYVGEGSEHACRAPNGGLLPIEY